MIDTALQKIGLTDGEIRVYEALLSLGSCTSGKITKSSGISGSKVYEVLDRLMNKGLATYIIKNGVKHFETTHPRKLMDYLLEKEQEIAKEKNIIEKIMPQLVAKQESSPKTEARIFTGWEGMKAANEDIIQGLKKGEEWLSMGLTEQPKAWERYFDKRQIYRAKKGIKHRVLLNEKYQALYHTRKKLAHTQFRFLPSSFEMPTSTEIHGNKVSLFILLQKSPIVIQIENTAVADSFRKYFEAMWEYAGQKTRVYYGKEGAVRVLHELAEAGKRGLPNYGYGTHTNPYWIHLRKDLEEFFAAEKKYKIKTKLLFMEGGEHTQPNAQIRYLPKEYVSPLRIMMTPEKVFMVDFTKQWTTIIIDKKEIASSFIKQFNMLWKLAKA